MGKNILALFISFFIIPATLAFPNEKIIEKITDKGGKEYHLILTGNLKNGISETSYILQSVDNSQDRFILYSGVQDGEGGGCHRAELLHIEKALIKNQHEIKDLNQDGWNDLHLNITEKLCDEQGNENDFEIEAYATEEGFTVDHIRSALIQVEPHAINLKTSRIVEVEPLKIKDKNNMEYEFGDNYELKHGKAWFEYYISATNDTEDKLIVYKGEAFGEGETCPENNNYVVLDKATTERKYLVKDFNNDGWDDIALYISEMECSNRTNIKITKLLVATEEGFQHKITFKREK